MAKTTDPLASEAEKLAGDIRDQLARILDTLPAAPTIRRAAALVELEKAARGLTALAKRTANGKPK